jgi:putative nucleotidyltransferase with HDIG domain
MATMDRQAAWELMAANVQAQGLRRHMLAVEAAMRWDAVKLKEDPEIWGLAGLLHDWDWEIHPTLEAHPAAGLPILREHGTDERVLQAIAAHNTEGTGVERSTLLDYALLACDEVTGLIIAAALVRPSKDVREVEVKSIKKRFKERTFAAGVDREHVEAVTADFSRVCCEGKLELWEHVGNVLEAMKGVAAELDLDGRLVGN